MTQAPAHPRTSAPAAAGTWRLVSDTATVEIDGAVVIGRQPSVELVPEASAVAIDDPQRTMSKTHAVLRASDGGLTVEDLSSTNGVHLVEGDSETRLPARTVTPLEAGARITFGDCAFAVERGE